MKLTEGHRAKSSYNATAWRIFSSRPSLHVGIRSPRNLLREQQFYPQLYKGSIVAENNVSLIQLIKLHSSSKDDLRIGGPAPPGSPPNDKQITFSGDDGGKEGPFYAKIILNIVVGAVTGFTLYHIISELRTQRTTNGEHDSRQLTSDSNVVQSPGVIPSSSSGHKYLTPNDKIQALKRLLREVFADLLLLKRQVEELTPKPPGDDLFFPIGGSAVMPYGKSLSDRHRLRSKAQVTATVEHVMGTAAATEHPSCREARPRFGGGRNVDGMLTSETLMQQGPTTIDHLVNEFFDGSSHYLVHHVEGFSQIRNRDPFPSLSSYANHRHLSQLPMYSDTRAALPKLLLHLQSAWEDVKTALHVQLRCHGDAVQMEKALLKRELGSRFRLLLAARGALSNVARNLNPFSEHGLTRFMTDGHGLSEMTAAERDGAAAAATFAMGPMSLTAGTFGNSDAEAEANAGVERRSAAQLSWHVQRLAAFSLVVARARHQTRRAASTASGGGDAGGGTPLHHTPDSLDPQHSKHRLFQQGQDSGAAVPAEVPASPVSPDPYGGGVGGGRIYGSGPATTSLAAAAGEGRRLASELLSRLVVFRPDGHLGQGRTEVGATGCVRLGGLAVVSAWASAGVADAPSSTLKNSPPRLTSDVLTVHEGKGLAAPGLAAPLLLTNNLERSRKKTLRREVPPADETDKSTAAAAAAAAAALPEAAQPQGEGRALPVDVHVDVLDIDMGGPGGDVCGSAADAARSRDGSVLEVVGNLCSPPILSERGADPEVEALETPGEWNSAATASCNDSDFHIVESLAISTTPTCNETRSPSPHGSPYDRPCADSGAVMYDDSGVPLAEEYFGASPIRTRRAASPDGDRRDSSREGICFLGRDEIRPKNEQDACIHGSGPVPLGRQAADQVTRGGSRRSIGFKVASVKNDAGKEVAFGVHRTTDYYLSTCRTSPDLSVHGAGTVESALQCPGSESGSGQWIPDCPGESKGVPVRDGSFRSLERLSTNRQDASARRDADEVRRRQSLGALPFSSVPLTRKYITSEIRSFWNPEGALADSGRRYGSNLQAIKEASDVSSSSSSDCRSLPPAPMRIHQISYKSTWTAELSASLPLADGIVLVPGIVVTRSTANRVAFFGAGEREGRSSPSATGSMGERETWEGAPDGREGASPGESKALAPTTMAGADVSAAAAPVRQESVTPSRGSVTRVFVGAKAKWSF